MDNRVDILTFDNARGFWIEIALDGKAIKHLGPYDTEAEREVRLDQLIKDLAQMPGASREQ